MLKTTFMIFFFLSIVLYYLDERYGSKPLIFKHIQLISQSSTICSAEMERTWRAEAFQEEIS